MAVPTEKEILEIITNTTENIQKKLKNSEKIRKKEEIIVSLIIGVLENEKELVGLLVESVQEVCAKKESEKLSMYHCNPLLYKDFSEARFKLFDVMNETKVRNAFFRWCKNEKEANNKAVCDFYNDTFITDEQALEVFALYYYEYRIDSIKLYWNIRKSSRSKDSCIRTTKELVDLFCSAAEDALSDVLGTLNEEQTTGKVKQDV